MEVHHWSLCWPLHAWLTPLSVDWFLVLLLPILESMATVTPRHLFPVFRRSHIKAGIFRLHIQFPLRRGELAQLGAGVHSWYKQVRFGKAVLLY